MKKYSVLLLYPDYQRQDDAETYLAHVLATNVEHAVIQAQMEASDADQDHDDFSCLLCCTGHIEDLSTRGQNYVDRKAK